MTSPHTIGGYERLARLQKRLEERGVVDIKFVWAWSKRDKPMSQLASDMCDVLEAYLDGRHKPLEPFGDSIRNRTDETNHGDQS